ncbi:phosphotransferase [Rhodobacteraceae bacterium SC52]|nr:phosphotransferase [Rhodobacteraceae bacterium SC52]
MTDPNWQDFIEKAGWGAATTAPLAGDASARRYLRLTAPNGARAVLMIAPPAPDDSTRRFCDISAHLSGMGLSVPAILSAAPSDGLALLEDLGDAVFARVIDADPSTELTLYGAAIDMLAALRTHPAPSSLPSPTATDMAAMTDLAADWYLGQGTANPDLAAAFAQALTPALQQVLTGPRILAHRDFHAENLIWLPERQGSARVGLLDFQDAFAGPDCYDLVSLLEDARRDITGALRAAMVTRFAERTGLAEAAVQRDLAVLGAQRNLRIMGVFARLCLAMGKPRYIDLMPRVWSHLSANLTHPALADLNALVTAHLPAPTPDYLEEMTSRCPRHPKP